MRAMLIKIMFSCLFATMLFLTSFAQNQPTKGIELFKSGNFVSASQELKNFLKNNPNSFEGNYYLGYSFLRLEKLKDAKNYFKKSLTINSEDLNANIGLAYTLTLQNQPDEAFTFVNKAILIDANVAEAYYILGYAHFRKGNFDEAVLNEDKAIKLNDKLASAYFVKAQAILNDTSESNSIIKTSSEKKEKSKFQLAVENMNKFIELSPNLLSDNYWVKQKETLQFFSNYFEKKRSDKDYKLEGITIKPFKIIRQPPALYTDSARRADISGTVRLLVQFREDGKVGFIFVLKSLERSLDGQALKAASNITFEPTKHNDKPVSVVRIVEYRFTRL
jgi:TonB family protein